MVIMDDLEWPMLSYYDKLRKVMKRTEKVALICMPYGEHMKEPMVNGIRKYAHRIEQSWVQLLFVI